MTSKGPAPLAGWWRRCGGYVLDVILIDVVVNIATRLIRDADVALRGPLSPGLHPMTDAAQAAVVIVAILVSVGYPLILLRSRGQTLGMMATGVTAIDRASGAALTMQQAWRRVLAFFVVTLLWLQVAAVIGFNAVGGPRPAGQVLFELVGIAGLLVTALWPLGNASKQTLQDKAAGTVVVRSRL